MKRHCKGTMGQGKSGYRKSFTSIRFNTDSILRLKDSTTTVLSKNNNLTYTNALSYIEISSTSRFFCPRGYVLFSVFSHCVECCSRLSHSCLEASLSCWNACLFSLENLLQRILFQQPPGCQWGLGFALCDDSEVLCQFFQAWTAWAPSWVASCFNHWKAGSQALPCFTILNLRMAVLTMLLVGASNSQRLLTFSLQVHNPII